MDDYMSHRRPKTLEEVLKALEEPEKKRPYHLKAFMREKVLREGFHDSRNYRYRLEEDKRRITRIALEELGTESCLSDKSEENPNGWETVETF